MTYYEPLVIWLVVITCHIVARVTQNAPVNFDAVLLVTVYMAIIYAFIPWV